MNRVTNSQFKTYYTSYPLNSLLGVSELFVLISYYLSIKDLVNLTRICTYARKLLRDKTDSSIRTLIRRRQSQIAISNIENKNFFTKEISLVDRNILNSKIQANNNLIKSPFQTYSYYTFLSSYRDILIAQNKYKELFIFSSEKMCEALKESLKEPCFTHFLESLSVFMTFDVINTSVISEVLKIFRWKNSQLIITNHKIIETSLDFSKPIILYKVDRNELIIDPEKMIFSEEEIYLWETYKINDDLTLHLTNIHDKSQLTYPNIFPLHSEDFSLENIERVYKWKDSLYFVIRGTLEQNKEEVYLFYEVRFDQHKKSHSFKIIGYNVYKNEFSSSLIYKILPKKNNWESEKIDEIYVDFHDNFLIISKTYYRKKLSDTNELLLRSEVFDLNCFIKFEEGKAVYSYNAYEQEKIGYFHLQNDYIYTTIKKSEVGEAFTEWQKKINFIDHKGRYTEVDIPPDYEFLYYNNFQAFFLVSQKNEGSSSIEKKLIYWDLLQKKEDSK